MPHDHEPLTMYVRYLGTKVCFTILETGGFVMVDRDRCSPEELALCDSGGGEMPATWGIRWVAAVQDAPPQTYS